MTLPHLTQTRYEVDGRGVAIATFDRPERHNVMNPEFMADLHRVMDHVEAGGVRALVLTGAGDSFCAGGDLAWMRTQLHLTREERVKNSGELATFLRRLDTLPVLTIARVNGQAFGGGVGMVAVCDMAFAVPGARFALTEVTLGLAPSNISPYVVKRIGAANARRTFLNARLMDAGMAAHLGLVTAVVDDLDAAIEAELAALMRCGPQAVAATKRLIAHVDTHDHEANAAYTARDLADDLQALADQVMTFCDKEVRPHADEWEAAGMVPRDVLRRMGDLGMFGLRVPEERGGLGLGPVASTAFAEALGRSSTVGGFDITVLVHTDMASPHLLHSGTDEQLDRFLPGILAGEVITAIGVTEPDAGSDVAGLRTTARRDGDGWRITGRKIFITNAVHGHLVILAARTDPSDRYGISMFLVEKDREGFEVAQKLEKIGWWSSDTAELVLDGVWVPDENLLGTPHRGFYEIMRNFQNERLVLAAQGVGAAQTAIDLTLEWVRSRPAFGGTLWDKQAIRQRLAMDQARLDAARTSVYHAAWLMERGDDATRYVSGVKASALETVMQIMYDCTQFHGGMGFMAETPVARMYRDARVNTIGGGATEVMLDEVAKRM